MSYVRQEREETDREVVHYMKNLRLASAHIDQADAMTAVRP